jgi:hypothetical protein
MRDNNRDARKGDMSTPVMAGLAVLVVFALLFMWAPWSGPRIADTTPFTTVGTSTTRPSANISPDSAPPAAPSTTPAAPSTTR